MVKRILLVGCALAFLAGCQIDKNMAINAGSDLYTAATLSEAEVKEMGKQSAAQMDSQNKVAAKGNAYTKRLNKIMAGLQNEDGLQLNYKVYLTSDINAFALPDGSIRVYSALMDLMEDDEIYFVLGHEIGHVKNGDSYDRFRVVHAAAAARKGAAATGGVAAQLSRSELGELGEAFVNAQFSQSQESAADAYGLRMMEKYKKNTASAVSGLRKLGGGKSSMLSSHPDSNTRADKIESMRKK